MRAISFIGSIPDLADQPNLTSDNKDESMGVISGTSEESVPLYISVFEGINVNLDLPTASSLSQKIA